MHKRNCKNGAPFLITPQAHEATKSSSWGECFGRPGMPLVPPVCLNHPGRLRGAAPRPRGPSMTSHPSHHTTAPLGRRAHPGKLHAGSAACTTVESLQLDEHQLCIVSKPKMLEHGAGNSKKQHEQIKCQRNEKYVQNCDRVFSYFSCDTVNHLSLKISNTWKEITEILKDTIFVF